MSKKIFAIIIMICMFISMFPILVFANTYTVKAMNEQTYTGTNYTFKYYTPNGYEDVYIANCGNSGIGIFFVNPEHDVYYANEETGLFAHKQKQGMYMTYVEDFDTVYEILFSGNTEEMNLTFTNEKYIYQLYVYSKTVEGDYKGTQGDTTIQRKTFENFYLDYYYEKYGYYPYSITINVSYMCDGETITTENQTTFQIMAGETKTINNFVSIIEGYNITDIHIVNRNDNQYIGLEEDYLFMTDTDITVILEEIKEEENAAGIIATLKQILSALQNYTSMDYLGAFSKVFPEAKQMISEKLADNEFYTSITAIKTRLEDLFNDDYSDSNGFYELELFNLTLGKQQKIKYKNYGNEVIGDWENVVSVEDVQVGIIKDGKMTDGVSLDFGIENAKLLNLDWYFGETFEDGTYTKGMKPTIDAFISAWLWVAFAVWLWKTLPDIVAGSIRDIQSIADSTVSAREYKTAKLEKEKNAEYKNSYEHYKENRDRNKQYNKRYNEERRKK